MHRQWHSLLRELKDAEQALGRETTEANYSWLQDVKARMLVLEQQAASKETVAAVTARLDRIEKKLDTLLMERPHGE